MWMLWLPSQFSSPNEVFFSVHQFNSATCGKQRSNPLLQVGLLNFYCMQDLTACMLNLVCKQQHALYFYFTSSNVFEHLVFEQLVSWIL